MRPCLLALALSALSATAARAADVRYFDDAALHAVQFVDAREGWAVGDEGVVWHTIDGGVSWERQPTGSRASLRSVHFLNPYTGWIAGREELPHDGGSAGVLLFTRDGGLKWQRVATNALPGLNRIRFVDHRTGFVIGDGTDQFATGIFRTTDSGRTWQPVPGKRSPGWLAADFQDADSAALAGTWGQLAVLRHGQLFKAEVDSLGGRAVHDVRVAGDRAVAVGQGGLVLTSRNSAGERWGFADLGVPATVRACWDFHAVFTVGDHVWAVGRPGSVVLHSVDRGQRWEVLRTGMPLPLNAIHFADPLHGWAVGEFGTILATADGGKTWSVRQRGGQRAALLFLHGRAQALPVDTLAILGAEEGYLAASLSMLAADPQSAAPACAAEPRRFAAAARLAGGASGEALWQFPMPQHLARAGKQELLGFWDTLHADRASEEVLRQAVLALRIWRPSVVVTDNPKDAATGWPVDALLAEAVATACARAGDGMVFPEQIQQLGLEPWKPVRIVGRWHTHIGADITLDLTAAESRLETSAQDFATPAAALLTDTPAALPTQRYFHVLGAGGAAHNLMQGIDLAVGGVARRKQPPPGEVDPQIEKAVQRRRNVLALAEASELADPNRLLAQVGPLLKTLPDDQAARSAFSVANHYARQGQWTLARELFLLMVDRYPAHPLAPDAYRWLIRHNASSEARRRHELGQFMVLTQATVRMAPGTPTEGTAVADGITSQAVNEEAVQKQQLALLSRQEETRRWYEGCEQIGARLAAFGPLYASDPSVQFCLQAARRRLGAFEKAQEWYKQFYTSQADGPWRDAAGAEVWLTSRVGTPPKPVLSCREVASRPVLDGLFDDPCWQGRKPLVLRNASGETLKEYPTEVRVAYDQDFLYLALRCGHPPDRHVAPVKVRPHDADVRPYDRVSLLLDLDRDYSTYFHFQVDQRGCVCDDCWGDLSWNPRWYVAVHSEKDSWQIEAAIPLLELTSDHITPGRAWACNIVRTIPGRGVQAWSLPADVQPRPEGMGLLLFTADPRAVSRIVGDPPMSKVR
jgi:photosystem II stability/assembly factor-like uncharacterized protein